MARGKKSRGKGPQRAMTLREMNAKALEKTKARLKALGWGKEALTLVVSANRDVARDLVNTNYVQALQSRDHEYGRMFDRNGRHAYMPVFTGELRDHVTGDKLASKEDIEEITGKTVHTVSLSKRADGMHVVARGENLTPGLHHERAHVKLNGGLTIQPAGFIPKPK